MTRSGSEHSLAIHVNVTLLICHDDRLRIKILELLFLILRPYHEGVCGKSAGE